MIALPQLPLDKANHVVYGLAAGLIGALLAAPIAAHIPLLAWGLPWHGALLGSALMGIGKELLDKYAGSGAPSWQDAAATVAGGAAIALATVASKFSLLG
jgi:hypothetical protein